MDRIHPSENYRPQQEHTSHNIINQLNIRYRVCHLYTEKKEQEEGITENEKICECGLEKGKHKPCIESSGTSWTMEHNTLEKINPYYGRLPNKALYVRLAKDTPLTKIEKILLEAWQIPKPRVIVSIIGGAKYFKLNDRLETNFINGIIDIAEKSDAWLFTTGYDTGIVHIVGQAINKVKLTKPEQKITAIGIGKWGCIANVEDLIYLNNKETEKKITGITKKSEKKRRHGEWNLEMNHSHYLMLDDGTVRKFELKDYRTRLAIHMARSQDDNDAAVPVVTIVVEGGEDTIANVYYDLKENIPVVLIDGSGRAADLLSRWLLRTKDLENEAENQKNTVEIDQSDKVKKKKANKLNSNASTTDSTTRHVDSKQNKLENMFTRYKHQLVEDLTDILPKNNKLEKHVNEIAKQVMYCLQPAVRSDITVFNLNSANDLSATIFESICQSRQKLAKRKEIERNDEAERKQKRSQVQSAREREKSESQSRISQKEKNAGRSKLLDLAMDWNCIDEAKKYIFRNSLDHILDKNELFLTTLKKNLPNFVYEFLELGFNPCEIFFQRNDPTLEQSRYRIFIRTLYNSKAVNDKKTHLRHFVDEDKAASEKKIDNVEKLNRTLSSLIGDYIHDLYFDTLEKEDEDRIKKGLRQKKRSLSDDERKQIANDYIIRDLFLWSILMNQIDMAKVFLSHMNYRICPALIAAKILQQYHHKATYGKLKYEYSKSMTYFQQYAINCLEKCHTHDPDKACEIVFQRNELYGYITCLQVAADANNKLFISTPTCVAAVNNVWYDKLHPEQTKITNKVSLFLGFVSLGLAAPVVVSYRKMNKEIKKIDPSEQRLNSNGIDYSDPRLLEYFVRPPAYPEYKRYFPKLKKFHQSLPMKLCYHLIIYYFTLLLFSYVLLFNFNPPTDQTPSIHWTEILTIILVTCMLIEEIHYFFAQDSLSWIGTFENYFGQMFKPMTFLGFLLFYIGLIVRFTYADSEVNFTAARIIMAIDVEIWWLRSLSFINIIPFLGPQLVAITKMLKDLLFFICIFAIVMIGYGVASRSMVYYPIVNGFTTATGGFIDTSFDGRSVFRQILYPVYYFLYGEYVGELANLDSNPNAGWSIATQVLLAIQMMLVNILLINLLIAIFTKQYDEIFDDIKIIWDSQKYSFTREYYTRSPFFPPISLVCDIYYLCRMFYFFIQRKRFNKSGDYQAKVFQMIPKNDSITKDWCDFEESTTYEYAHDEIKAMKIASTKSTENQEDMADNGNNANDTVDGLKQVEENLKKLNDRIEAVRGEVQNEKEKKQNI